MRILIVTPARPGTRHGNRVTALRWARLLRQLGHRVRVTVRYQGESADLLVALHARRSAAAVRAFARRYPDRPLVVALTGTDLYRDLPRSRAAQESLAHATRLVVLQPLAVRRLPWHLRERVRVILQSATAARVRRRGSGRWFVVCVIGHLRPVKDPLRVALAARHLPPQSRIRVLQAGTAMTAALAARARAEMQRNPRYRWLGELPGWRVRRLLARAHLLVLPSRMEGGANVLSEAIAAAVPVLASRIDGNVGLLGPRYPGYFPAGDTHRLARLLWRAENDRQFRARLTQAVRRLRPLVSPARERAAWTRLLAELGRAR